MVLDDPAPVRLDDTVARLGVLERAGDPGLTALTRVASYITGGAAAAVHVLDDAAQHRVAATGAPLGDHPREDAMCHLVVDSEQRIVCEDATRDPRFGFSSFVRGDAPVRFYVSVPLRTSRGLVIGTLCAFDTVEREISDEQLERLADVADQVVAQIELTRVAVELGELATRDPLTGAVNRLVLGDRLAQAFARRARHGGETLLALLDVDRFKAINDELGHDAGDRVLAEIARRLGEALRPEDTVARIGGDEFVVLAEITSPAPVTPELPGRLRAALAAPIDLAGAGERSVTASIGCVLANPGEPLRELLARADEAMYAEKRAGARA